MPPENTQNEQKLQEARAELQKAQAEVARLQEAFVLRDAKDVAAVALAKAVKDVQIPDIMRERMVKLSESLSTNPPTAEGKLDEAKLTAAVEAMVKGELDYLAKLTGQGSGRITGMSNGNGSASTEADRAALVESFKRLGLDDKAALIAAEGR
jgi:hypothetical protein